MSIYYNNISINSFLLNIILINILKLTNEKYITIPFKVVNNNEPEIFSSLDDYFRSWYEISFYGQISVGTPPQKLITKLTFDDYGISILNKGCNFNNYSNDINISLDLKKSSTSFNDSYVNLNGDNKFLYKSFRDAFYAKDIFYFDSIKSNNDKIKIEDFNFIYSPSDNKKMITCMNIGFKAYPQNSREVSLNIIKQLKNKNIINNYDWSIIFDNNKKYPDNGIFLIGAKPHDYNPELYNDKDLFGSGSYSDDTTPYFNFKINDIYFDSPLNSSDKIYITDLDELHLIPTNGLIKASQDYEKKIEINFFDYFINENKCFKEYRVKTSKDSFRTFICYNKQNIKKELKEKFPVLKFKQKNFLYTFELNYDDLFKEKGDKIYFLVWFSSSKKTAWELGYPFMKKYTFNYNYDNKLVSFYNNKNEEEDNKSTKNSFKINKTFIIIILIIIVTILGFIIGKKFRKKKKLTAEELESQFNPSLYENNEIPYKPHSFTT